MKNFCESCKDFRKFYSFLQKILDSNDFPKIPKEYFIVVNEYKEVNSCHILKFLYLFQNFWKLKIRAQAHIWNSETFKTNMRPIREPRQKMFEASSGYWVLGFRFSSVEVPENSPKFGCKRGHFHHFCRQFNTKPLYVIKYIL